MSSIRVVMIAALLPLSLGACSLFRSHSAWQEAQETRPLEIPPDLDTPTTSGGLVVPSATGSAMAAEAPRGGRHSTSPVGIDGLHVDDTVESTWSRVGTALERAQVGEIAARDQASHTYSLNLSVTHSSDEGRGWFKRLVTREKKTTATKQVSLGVSEDNGGSRVSVSGDRDAVQKVVAALRERLG
jgi:uncharacterized lipoprotein